jgi:hypothetical protein
MRIDRMTRCFAAWLASIAMLFAALAPSMSQAMAVASGDTWTEICSMGGTRFVKVASTTGDVSDHAPSDAGHVDHCPLCATHAGSFALPPGAGYSIPLIDTQQTHSFLFFQSPYPLAIWKRAQARAPPLRS